MPIDTELCFFLHRYWFVVLMLCIVALFQPHSLWCFFSCWGVTKYACAQNLYPRLEKHADDGHHRKSSVSDFGIKLFGLLSRVRRGQHLESKVSSIRSTSWGLFLGDLAESHVGQDLTPSSRVGILGFSTHINQQCNMLYCHSFSVGLETINCISSYHKYIYRVSTNISTTFKGWYMKINVYVIWIWIWIWWIWWLSWLSWLSWFS